MLLFGFLLYLSCMKVCTVHAQLLLAYAGPSSNVRVERTSRNCFNGGGALAEVMSLYEKVDEDTLNAECLTQQVCVRGEENHRLGVEVSITLFFNKKYMLLLVLSFH